MKKKKAPSITKLKKKLWVLCRDIVRIKYSRKDGFWNCYTCGIFISNPSDAHTAHFLASSICGSQLRFDLRNLRVCCGKCNVWLGGNYPAYYENMCKEIGREATDALMLERHKTQKVDVIWYMRKIDEYTCLLETLLKKAN